MKNKEKFKDEIVNIICSGNSIAIDKETLVPMVCSNTDCFNCLFYNIKLDCIGALVNWADQEYKEPNVISYNDSLFLNFIPDEYEYIARDKNGKLFLHKNKPHKLEDCDVWCSEKVCWLCRFEADFPMIKWTDEQPWKISYLKRLKVVKNY